MRTLRRLISSSLIIFVSANLASNSAHAQTKDAEVAGPGSSVQLQEEKIIVGNRTLNDFTFIPSIFVDGPFTGTFVSMFTGYGVAPNVKLDLYDKNGEYISTVGGDLIFLILQFAYQQKIVDWLSVNLKFAGSARVGTAFEAMMSEGLSAIFDVGVGGIARIYRSERFF